MSTVDTSGESNTIVAVATPPGRGGIGVVRLSGPESLRIADQLFPAEAAIRARQAHYRVLRDANGERLDDAVLTWFKAPSSYTGEDVVEIATHGSPVVQDWIVRACVGFGAEPARPGEFTERAFLNGRLDLTAAEAVRDLIDSQTLEQARLAAQQIGGSIAAAVLPIKQSLLELIAELEAGIDFAEDDIATMPQGRIADRIDAILAPVGTLLATFSHGRLLRNGVRLVLAGEPNVGKSSLFNRLVEQERAIVTAMPGTTRDVVSERISLDGIPVELLDTAGLRETTDEVERMGVHRSKHAIAEADAVLVLVDARDPETRIDHEAYSLLAGRPVLLVQNKIDLLAAEPASERRSSGDPPVEWRSVRISTYSGEGMTELKQELHKLLAANAHNAGSATLTNVRQQQAVERMQTALQRAKSGVGQQVPHELILLDLYETLQAQNELTGETTPDDVLSLIFSSFCIGK